MDEKELSCYAETADGLVRLKVRKDNDGVSIWENDDLRDDLESFEELLEEYGESYYDFKEDFKKDNGKKFTDYFK